MRRACAEVVEREADRLADMDESVLHPELRPAMEWAVASLRGLSRQIEKLPTAVME